MNNTTCLKMYISGGGGGGWGGALGSIFAGYVPLASQSPKPIIAILWPIIIIDPVLVTFVEM